MLNDSEVKDLKNLIKDSFRVRPNQDPIYIDVADHLDRLKAKQHQIIFGRRGSGKSCLLVHFKNNENKKRKSLSMYIETDEIKRLGYPDVLIRLLLAVMEQTPSAKQWWRKLIFRKTNIQKNIGLLRKLLDQAEQRTVKQEETQSTNYGGKGNVKGVEGNFGRTTSKGTLSEFEENKLDTLERYTFDWKDGKPKDGSMNGLGVFFKYQRLEQYEEALENIAFKASEDTLQKTLEFDQYIPKYFLDFETKGSQSLVNTAAMQDPWDYKLKEWDGFTYDTEQAVDLVETFNYLIGLHMQKCITKEINGQKYQFVYGHNNANKNILVVWRLVKEWSLEDYKADASALKEEFKAFAYDLLYINDQAHIEGYQPI